MLPQVTWRRKAAVLAFLAIASAILVIVPGSPPAARPSAAAAALPALSASVALSPARHGHDRAPLALPGIPALSVPLSAAQIGALWIAAGGSAAAQATAECIAWYESRDVPARGLWRIPAADDGRTIGGTQILISGSPSASARDAVALSRDGRDWHRFRGSSRCAG
jgi:hypothetical protein